jgi:hypothetical protein
MNELMPLMQLKHEINFTKALLIFSRIYSGQPLNKQYIYRRLSGFIKKRVLLILIGLMIDDNPNQVKTY